MYNDPYKLGVKCLDTDQLHSRSQQQRHTGSVSSNMRRSKHTVSTVSQRCMFWKLPLELRDMVYQLLYSSGRTIKIQCRSEARPDPSTFPDSMLSDLLVNKQYCEEASRIWLASKTFSFGVSVGMRRRLSKLTLIEVYLLRSITTIEFSSWYSMYDFDFAQAWPRLSSFTSTLDTGAFTYLRSKNPLYDEYTDIELAELPEFKSLLTIRNLKELNITWRDPSDRKVTAAQLEIWHRTAAQTERLLRDVIFQPAEPATESPSQETFQDAISQSIAIRKGEKLRKRKEEKAQRKARIVTMITPVCDHEIPTTEAELVRLCLLRPRAMLRWMEDSKQIRTLFDDDVVSLD